MIDEFPVFLFLLFFAVELGRISASFGTVATSGGAFESRKLKSKPDSEQRVTLTDAKPMQHSATLYRRISKGMVCKGLVVSISIICKRCGAWLAFGDLLPCTLGNKTNFHLIARDCSRKTAGFSHTDCEHTNKDCNSCVGSDTLSETCP